ncbi:MAG: LemA family protein [Gammaproteobacteria bacterium]
MLAILFTALAAGFLLWMIVIYNRLVRDKNRVLAAWSDIDVQLKRRHELIPKLVNAVKSYVRYERGVLEKMTRLRTESASANLPPEKSRAENRLTSGLRELLAVMENYPDLKASEQYLALQRNLSGIENDIQSARRYYNGAARNLNIRIDSFPDLLIARTFGYRHADFFELDSLTESRPPDIEP